MNRLLDLMTDLGYVAERPTDYAELQYQREAVRALRRVPAPARA